MVRSLGSTRGRAAAGIRDHCAMLSRGLLGPVGTAVTGAAARRAGSSTLLNPGVQRVEGGCQLPSPASHDPEVVERITRRSNDRMVARLDDGHVSVAHHEHLVGRVTCAVIANLHAEATGRVELEVVDLLELNLVRR